MDSRTSKHDEKLSKRIAKAICVDATDATYPILWYYRTGGVSISGREVHVTIDLTHTTLLPAMTFSATECCFGRFVPIAVRLDRRKKEILDLL